MHLHKRIVLGCVSIIAIALLSGCVATVTLSSMVPAGIDLSEHRNLAVLSAEPYRFSLFDSPSGTVRDLSGTSQYRVGSGFGTYMERDIARHLTEQVVRDLERAGYFTLMVPPSSDRVGGRPEQFHDLGYDALLTVRTTDLDVDEYQYAKEELVSTPPAGGVGDPVVTKVLRHHVMQKVRYAIEFTVRDAADGKILASKTYSGTKEQSYRIEPGTSASRNAPSLYPWFTSLSERFSREFADLVSPHWVTKTVSLMRNKPELRSLETAYAAVKEGNPAIALELFRSEWQRSAHVPSGYNAAIILDSMGQAEQAIDLMRTVWQYSGNNLARLRLLEMEEAWASHKQAQSQL